MRRHSAAVRPENLFQSADFAVGLFSELDLAGSDVLVFVESDGFPAAFSLEPFAVPSLPLVSLEDSLLPLDRA
jgi:hypothetical protein